VEETKALEFLEEKVVVSLDCFRNEMRYSAVEEEGRLVRLYTALKTTGGGRRALSRAESGPFLAMGVLPREQSRANAFAFILSP